jgi:hypothetical protein
MDAKELIRKWLEYAKEHRIRAGNFSGTEPTTTDVIEFLTGEGFSKNSVNDIVSQFVVPSKTPDVVPADVPKQDAPAQQKYVEPDDSDADLPDLTQSQEEDLSIVYRIIGKLDKPQLMQLKRELKYV